MSTATSLVFLVVVLAGAAGGLLLARWRAAGAEGEDPRSAEPLFFTRHRP